MHKVGFIIPFFGGNKYLPFLLDSIWQSCESYDLTVYIIDNSGTGERVDRNLITRPEVKVIEAGTAIGYGKACNIGYQHCKTNGCDVLVVVNQDGYFASGSLELMVNILLNNEGYSVAVPLLTKYESDTVEWFFTHVYITYME